MSAAINYEKHIKSLTLKYQRKNMNTKKDNLLRIRISTSDKQRIIKDAKHQQKTISSYVRGELVNKLDKHEQREL